MEMNFLTKAIKALNKINRNKFYRDYAKVLNNTKLSDWGGIKPSVKDLEPYDIYMLGKIEEIEENMPQPVEQVQSDWNQNDENAPDYIKNRICYEGWDDLADECPVLIGENGQTNFAFTPLHPIVVGGTMYVKVSDEIVHFKIMGTPDGSAGGGSTSDFQYGGNLGLSFDANTAHIQFNGNPAYYANKEIAFVKQLYVKQPIESKYIPQLGGVQFKIDDTSLKASLDGGSTWKTVTLA